VKVRTVTGDNSPDDLGVTLPHEHVLVDISCRVRETEDPHLRGLTDEPVHCGLTWDLMRNPLISKDNLRLTDVDLAVENPKRMLSF
jgi:phosphotriesterase-related protein